MSDKDGTVFIVPLYIDPKSTGRTEYVHKIDGYRALFEENGSPKVFHHQELDVIVNVFLYTPDRQYLAEGYRKYWFDNIEHVMQLLDSEG